MDSRAFALMCPLFVAVASMSHLSSNELRKGIAVALGWKKLSFEQRKEMIENLLSMPNFSAVLQNELVESIERTPNLDKIERQILIKMVLIKANMHMANPFPSGSNDVVIG